MRASIGEFVLDDFNQEDHIKNKKDHVKVKRMLQGAFQNSLLSHDYLNNNSFVATIFPNEKSFNEFVSANQPQNHVITPLFYQDLQKEDVIETNNKHKYSEAFKDKNEHNTLRAKSQYKDHLNEDKKYKTFSYERFSDESDANPIIFYDLKQDYNLEQDYERSDCNTIEIEQTKTITKDVTIEEDIKVVRFDLMQEKLTAHCSLYNLSEIHNLPSSVISQEFTTKTTKTTTIISETTETKIKHTR